MVNKQERNKSSDTKLEFSLTLKMDWNMNI